jgi:hypothetical protein
MMRNRNQARITCANIAWYTTSTILGTFTSGTSQYQELRGIPEENHFQFS